MTQYLVNLTDEQAEGIEALGIAVQTYNAPKKQTIWDLSKQAWRFDAQSNIYNCAENNIVSAFHGTYRKTKQACKLAAQRSKNTNIISAWADEMNGEEIWVEGKMQYIICKRQNKWYPSQRTFEYNPGTIYMTEKCANTLCENLNNNIIQL